MRQWKPIKFKKMTMRMGFAPKKANTGFLDWPYLMKKFYLHKNEIFRRRKSQAQLRIAFQRLSKLQVYRGKS